MVDLSIAVVSYNTKGLLRRCLDSIYKNTKGISFEVFVVDNASKDGSATMLAEEFPKVSLIKNLYNLGFARANNQALALAQGRYFLLLNSDTEIINNALGTLVAFMEQTPECGICCPQLYFPNGQAQASYTPFKSLLQKVVEPISPRVRDTFRVLGLKKSSFKKNKKVDPKDKPHLVERPRGACFLIRKSCIDEIGQMDERFFMYCEEVDWAFRAVKAGWQNYCVPQAKVKHFGSASTSQAASLMDDIHTQSDYYYIYKHFGWLGWSALRAGYLMASAMTFVPLSTSWLFSRFNRSAVTPKSQIEVLENLVRRALIYKPIRPHD